MKCFYSASANSAVGGRRLNWIFMVQYFRTIFLNGMALFETNKNIAGRIFWTYTYKTLLFYWFYFTFLRTYQKPFFKLKIHSKFTHQLVLKLSEIPMKNWHFLPRKISVDLAINTNTLNESLI